MVRAGAFELHVLVGGVKQAELVTPAGVHYVESVFAVPGVSYSVSSRETDPWGEEFTQTWPVTPYTLKLVNHSGDTAYCKVSVDGAPACSQYLRPGDNEINGFKDATGRRSRRRGEMSAALTARARAQKRGCARVHLHASAAREREEGREPGAAVHRRGEGARRWARAPRAEPRRAVAATGPQLCCALTSHARPQAALKAQLESIRVQVFGCKFLRTEERMVGTHSRPQLIRRSSR